MTRSSAEEKLVLTFLITNCVIYRLNEKEALKYIQYNLSKPISRRTFYNYKKTIYDNYSSPLSDSKENDKKDLQSFSLLPLINDPFNCKSLIRYSLLNAKEELFQEGLNLNICLDDFDDLIFFPIHFINLLNHAESVISRSKNFIKQFESRSNFNNVYSKSLPNNVTIRAEYVKCGKISCLTCKHGPYYYGYWREKNGKLKKKYMGINK
jgi:hypothetical protein